MIRRLSPFIVLVALLMAAEPVLHSHPLDSDLSGGSAKTACAICAAGIGRLPRVAVMMSAPQAFQDAYICSVAPVVLAGVPLPRSPRAPPAA